MPFAAYLDPIDERAETMAALVARWAAVDTASSHVEGLELMAGELRQALEDLGATAELVSLPVAPDAAPLGPAVAAVRRPEAPLRVLLGIHLDTVCDPDHPSPAATRTDAHTLRGLGVADAKGGLAVMLEALAAFEESPWAAGLGWEVLVNPDEEIGSPGSRPLFAAAARRCRLGLLFEPSLADGALVSARKGSGVYALEVRGRTAHAGRDPEKGRNAVLALAELVVRVAGLGGDGILVNPARLEGGSPVNVVPAWAACHLNVRVDTPGEQAQVEAGLAALVQEFSLRDGLSVTLRGSFGRPPKPLDAGTEELLRELAACGRELGLDLAWRPSGGASDGNLLAAAGLPTVDSLGPRGGELHSDREYILLDSLPERAKLAALFLMRLAARELGTGR